MLLFQGGAKVISLKCIIHCLSKINHNSRSQMKQPMPMVQNLLAAKTVRFIPQFYDSYKLTTASILLNCSQRIYESAFK